MGCRKGYPPLVPMPRIEHNTRSRKKKATVVNGSRFPTKRYVLRDSKGFREHLAQALTLQDAKLRLGDGNYLPKVIRHLLHVRSRYLTLVFEVQHSFHYSRLSSSTPTKPPPTAFSQEVRWWKDRGHWCQTRVQILILLLNCHLTLYSIQIIPL